MDSSSPTSPRRGRAQLWKTTGRSVSLLFVAFLLLGTEGDSCQARSDLLCAATTDCTEPAQCVLGLCIEPEPCVCTAHYAPVCGADGQSYSNACEAECSAVEVLHEGECEQACATNEDCAKDLICYPPTERCQPICQIACFRYDPVCGTDGQTYGCGQEDTWCHGAEVAHPGECEDIEDCSPAECGPGLGAPNYLCEDGSIGGPGPCVRNEDGVCGWTFRDCPR